MKNNVVTTVSATLLVDAGAPTALVILGTFAIAMDIFRLTVLETSPCQNHTTAKVGVDRLSTPRLVADSQATVTANSAGCDEPTIFAS